MISKTDIKLLTQKEPKFDDIFCSLRATGKQPKGMIKETQKVVALARKFNNEVVRPTVLELDQKLHQDPEYLPWEFVKKANEWGFYTMFLPKIFGGQGYNMPSFSPFVEEIGSVCLGMANLIGVHYLGFATACSSWNARVIKKLCFDIVTGEKSGNPCLVSLALTEPSAGTDVEEVELMDKGDISCHARKVEGGYIVNGNKIFISNGHLSGWHILIAYTDLKKASENTVMLAVKTGTKGFSFGKIEKKMGQKACPASELIFSDCFIPDENVCIDNQDMAKLSKSRQKTNEQIIAYYFGASRAGVGAFGAAAARGAYEQALQFASHTMVDGRPLIQYEWCQSMLAEMYKNVSIARLTYMEANYANGMHGMFKLLQLKPLYYLLKFLPQIVMDKIIFPFLEKPFATWLLRKLCFDRQLDEEFKRTSGWSSLAKFCGTDAGMQNCHLAMDMMGQTGLRHDSRMEKCFRDAKLLQIYEGTNQLNRLNLFKCLVANEKQEALMFEE